MEKPLSSTRSHKNNRKSLFETSKISAEMKKTRYLDHVDLRVSDLKRAHKFYGKLLPALGFTCDRSSGRWGIFYAAGGDKPEAFFGFTQDRRHQPNGTRIAFWADTRERSEERRVGKECRSRWSRYH